MSMWLKFVRPHPFGMAIGDCNRPSAQAPGQSFSTEKFRTKFWLKSLIRIPSGQQLCKILSPENLSKITKNLHVFKIPFVSHDFGSY